MWILLIVFLSINKHIKLNKALNIKGALIIINDLRISGYSLLLTEIVTCISFFKSPLKNCETFRSFISIITVYFLTVLLDISEYAGNPILTIRSKFNIQNTRISSIERTYRASCILDLLIKLIKTGSPSLSQWYNP